MEGPVHPDIWAVRVPTLAWHFRGPRALQGLLQQFLRPFWCLDRLEPAEGSGRRLQRQMGPAWVWPSFSPSGLCPCAVLHRPASDAPRDDPQSVPHPDQSQVPVGWPGKWTTLLTTVLFNGIP